MNGFFLGATLAVGVLILAGLGAAWRGPTVFDRLIAVSQVTVNTVVMIVLLGFFTGRPELYLDMALAYALLAFIVPLALGRYFDAVEDPSADRTGGGQ